MYTYIVGAGILITLSSLSGIIFSWKFIGAWIEPRLRYLIALASGVFMAIIVDLATEVLREGSPLTALLAFALGVLTISLVTKLIPDTHHHHGPHPEHHHQRIDARRVLLGDAVHNIHDGIMLVPAFLVSIPVGVATAGAILLHELVQEISQFFILREAGYTPSQALVRNLAAQLTIWIGIAVSATLISIHSIEVPLIAFAAGGFTYILLRDLLPSVIMHARTERRTLRYLFMFLLGLALMTTVSLLAPHHHPEDTLPLPEGFGLAVAPPSAFLESAT